MALSHPHTHCVLAGLCRLRRDYQLPALFSDRRHGHSRALLSPDYWSGMGIPEQHLSARALYREKKRGDPKQKRKEKATFRSTCADTFACCLWRAFLCEYIAVFVSFKMKEKSTLWTNRILTQDTY